MSNRFEKHVPVMQLDEITSTEENILAELAAISFQTGDLIYYNGADLVRLAIGTSGQYLVTTGGIPTWTSVAASGDVVGPASSVDAAVALFDGTSGKLLRQSSVTISGGSITGLTDFLTGIVNIAFASGAVLNFNANDVLVTHSANLLTITGGGLTVSGLTTSTTLTVTSTTTLDTTLNGLAVLTAGVVSATSDATSYVSAASTILAGKVELATTAEINTGTDNERAMPVDQFVASNRNMRYFNIRVLDPSSFNFVTDVIGGDFECPITGTITEIGAWVDTAGTTGVGTIDVNKNGVTILSTKITIDSTEKTSRTALTPAVISVSAIAAGDIITVDLDGIQTTPAKGLVIRVGIRMT